MHSSFGQVIRRHTRRIATSPLILWLTAQGGLMAWMSNNGVWGTWDNIGWGMLATGVGTALYRSTVGWKKHRGLAEEDLRRVAKRKELTALRRLKRSMGVARDARVNNSIDNLSSAFDRLLQVDRWRSDKANAKRLEIGEVHDQAAKLYIECRNLLGKSHELFVGASQMATQEIRNRVMGSREDVIRELQTSLNHLNHGLDEVYSAQLAGNSGPINEATELRDELRRQVEVARQVEERMDELAGGNWTIAEEVTE